MQNLRIGQGFDVHAFGPGDHVTLGGLKIPHTQGLKAHSDGDVVLHALCDALLGSLALGDIGQHFPDTDSQYAGADSRELLKHVYALITKQGYTLQNADITVIAQAPKLASYIPGMRETIVADLSVVDTAVSIKATTSEHLGFTGRGEGIAVLASVLVGQQA